MELDYQPIIDCPIKFECRENRKTLSKIVITSKSPKLLENRDQQILDTLRGIVLESEVREFFFFNIKCHFKIYSLRARQGLVRVGPGDQGL